jgi:UDP-N-acetylglucosamine--N-acetylmuramyl-(pentapeptide) pyrophosphoryl-undecaprenol N-acetylglucosamine transferase
MRGPALRPFLIAAGGTGGHFFPAEALAAVLVSRGHPVALMTDARSGGERSPVFAGRDATVLRGAGLAGRGALRAAQGAAALGLGTLQARAVLARRPPACIIAFGGYPAVAPVLASRLVRGRIPVILHEQNAVLGRANRALSRFATQLALSFADTARVPPGTATALTGNPVRPAIQALAGQGYASPGAGAPVRLLVLGGSLGARALSDTVPAAVGALPPALRARLHVTQQCRREDLDRVRAAYAALGVAAELSAFFADVASLLAGAHLVVARAGASTVAELAVAGRPAILVPLPGAIDDHQAANARALGADTLPQADLTPASLATRITALLDAPASLEARAAAAAAHAMPDAASLLADLAESVAGREHVA